MRSRLNANRGLRPARASAPAQPALLRARPARLSDSGEPGPFAPGRNSGGQRAGQRSRPAVFTRGWRAHLARPRPPVQALEINTSCLSNNPY